MRIETDLRPDWIYPAESVKGEIVAQAQFADGTVLLVGVLYRVGYGQVAYLGFRPRDDQSGSTGTDWRTLFEVLQALGAYRGEDQPEALSRAGDILVCQFPNGSISVARQYARIKETWAGDFFRDEASDAALRLDLPSVRVELDGEKVKGHEVSFRGSDLLSYRLDESGNLIAFYGRDTTEITVDGRAYQFSPVPIELLFAPLHPERLADGIRQAVLISAGPVTGDKEGSLYEWLDVRVSKNELAAPLTVTLPVNTTGWSNVHLGVLASLQGQIERELSVRLSQELTLQLDGSLAHRWLVLYETA